MSSFVIKAGNTLPPLQVALLDEDGDPINLSAVDSVAFRMKRVGSSTYTVSGPATVFNATTGEVQYNWMTADTATAGEFEAEFVVTDDGRTQAYPGGEELKVQVFADDTIAPADLVFCTVEQAHALFNEDFDADELFKAQLILSVRTGILPDSDTDDPSDWDELNYSDRLGLMQAVVFQAKWMRGQDDLFERLNITSESADGASYTYANTTALLMAPMAEWALGSTSWSNASGYATITTPPAGLLASLPLDETEIGWRRTDWSTGLL